MTRKEYKECVAYEVYRQFKKTGKKLTLLQKLRIKYFQPNTNCIYLARKMWYLQSCCGGGGVFAKLLYLKILKKYNCIIFPTAVVGKGFHITHPVGIIIGKCSVGENFMIFQNCTIGTKHPGGEGPHIGSNVRLCTNSIVLGDIAITNRVVIGAASLVIKDIDESGIYGGNPIRKIKQYSDEEYSSPIQS